MNVKNDRGDVVGVIVKLGSDWKFHPRVDSLNQITMLDIYLQLNKLNSDKDKE